MMLFSFIFMDTNLQRLLSLASLVKLVVGGTVLCFRLIESKPKHSFFIKMIDASCTTANF